MSFVAFGESLFRTVTARGERLATAQNLGFYLGGTELNIAANLVALGIPATWVSALPNGPTGELILEKVKGLGVDTRFCKTAASSRVGWYLMESGAAPRPDIVYHRNASAMADETSLSFDWSAILAKTKVFHSSGVTCGISQALTSELVQVAKRCEQKNILFSYDLNYRKNVWTLQESERRQKDLIKEAKILFCSNADLQLFYGDGFADEHFKKVFANSKTEILVMSQRSDDQLEYGIEVVARKERYASKRYRVAAVDRIGAGDAAAAGFFKIFLTDPAQLALAAEWAAACGALKSGVMGDMLLMKSQEVERVIANPQSGIVR